MISIDPHMLLAAGWIVWCLLHSGLIARGWMRTMDRALGARMAYYRLIYVVFSVLSLLPVLFLQFTIQSPVILSLPLFLVVLRWIGVALSLLIFWWAARQYDQAFFFGFRQIRENRAGLDAQFSGFVATGILRRIRHPYYSAGMLLLLCWGEITLANLIFKAIGIAYFLIGAVLEERKLVAEFGDDYRQYQREVPMFIPRLSR